MHTLLNSQVLVLNRLWQAVNICSARRAFTVAEIKRILKVCGDDEEWRGLVLFGLYLGLMVWGGLWLRDRSLRSLLPFRR